MDSVEGRTASSPISMPRPDAGLVHVAVFGDDGALDGGYGIVELHERRQLEAELLQADAGPTVEDLADLRRAGEADKAHGRVLAQNLADPPESPAMTLKTLLGTPAFSARAASATAESGV